MDQQAEVELECVDGWEQYYRHAISNILSGMVAHLLSNCAGFKKVLGELLGPWAGVLGAKSLDLSSLFVIEINCTGC